MSIIDLVIGVPAYGGRVSVEQTRMFLTLGHALAASESRFRLKGWTFVDTCGIDIARNQLLATARKANASWLLMIDADTWVVDDGEDTAGFQLLSMISEADHMGAAIVGAPVIRRRADGNKREVMAYRYVERLRSPLAIKPEPMLTSFDPPQILTTADAIATAVFAVNVAKTQGLSFKFTDELSEDLDFCRQVRERGEQVLVDGRVHTAHLSRPYPILSHQ